MAGWWLVGPGKVGDTVLKEKVGPRWFRDPDHPEGKEEGEGGTVGKAAAEALENLIGYGEFFSAFGKVRKTDAVEILKLLGPHAAHVAEALTVKLEQPDRARDGAKRALEALKEHKGYYPEAAKKVVRAFRIGLVGYPTLEQGLEEGAERHNH